MIRASPIAHFCCGSDSECNCRSAQKKRKATPHMVLDCRGGRPGTLPASACGPSGRTGPAPPRWWTAPRRRGRCCGLRSTRRCCWRASTPTSSPSTADRTRDPGPVPSAAVPLPRPMRPSHPTTPVPGHFTPRQRSPYLYGNGTKWDPPTSLPDLPPPARPLPPPRTFSPLCTCFGCALCATVRRGSPPLPNLQDQK